jgi:hypothetical protein
VLPRQRAQQHHTGSDPGRGKGGVVAAEGKSLIEVWVVQRYHGGTKTRGWGILTPTSRSTEGRCRRRLTKQRIILVVGGGYDTRDKGYHGIISMLLY